MKRVKYARTHNLPWSGSDSSDDVWWEDTSRFDGKEVVVTEKLDGECTTIYPDGHVHARSIDTRHHPSRSHVKALSARMHFMMASHVRLCGENVTAYHSIFYEELPDFFLGFGVYEMVDGVDICCSWELVGDMCCAWEIPTVPVIYKGIWDEKIIRDLWTGKGAFPTFDSPSGTPCEAEGYVVRVTEAFPRSEFQNNCAKYVRPHHVQTSSNWLTQPMVPNLLKK